MYFADSRTELANSQAELETAFIKALSIPFSTGDTMAAGTSLPCNYKGRVHTN